MADETPPPMSVGDCLGSTATVTHAGKTWTLGRPTPAAIEAVEREVARICYDEAKALAGVVPGADGEVKARLLARQHRPGGPLWDYVFQTAAALPLQLWAMASQHHPELTLGQAKAVYQGAPDECELALILVSPDFSAALADRVEMPPARADRAVREQAGKRAAAVARK